MKKNNDFLSQFNNDNYADQSKKTATESIKENPVSQPDHTKKSEPSSPIDTSKKSVPTDLSKKLGSTKKMTSSSPSSSKKKIAGPEYLVERDTTYHKRKIIRYGIIGSSIVALCICAFFIFRLVNRVEIMDFNGTTINDARVWGISNSIGIQEDFVYSIDYDENIIMEQSVEPQDHLQRGSVLRLTISKGPDMDEVVEIPDLESMTTAEVRNWIRELRVVNATVVEEYSEEVEAGSFISREFTPDSLTDEEFTRNDRLRITMSRGVEMFTVPNFGQATREEVEAWATENEFNVTITEQPSAEIEAGNVISQSVEPRQRVSRADELIVTISAGPSIIVPNFNQLTHEEAMEIEGLTVIQRHRLSADVPFGRVISQSEAAGAEVFGLEPRVVVTYSLGRPYMRNLIGESQSGIAEHFFTEFTSRGANITYTIRHVDSAEPKGSIVSMSRYAEFLAMTDHVNINVSRGNLTPPAPSLPDFPEAPEAPEAE